MHGNKHEMLRLCALLLAIAALACFFLTQKAGYHLDEGLTMSLANGEGDMEFRTMAVEPGGLRRFCLDYVFDGSFFSSIKNIFAIGFDFLQKGENSQWYQLYQESYAPSAGGMAWVDAKAHFIDLATVTDDNPLSRILTVYSNQASDVHPPFYYLLLNLVCSFFPETYADWYPFSVNLVFLLLSCLLVYQTVRRYFGGEWLALAAVALYGFSCGFLSTAVLFRMYAVLTFFCVWALWCHLELIRMNGRASRGLSLQLVFVNVLGFYTQYYFIIYSAFLALAALVFMLTRKQVKNSLRYLGLMAAAVLLSLIIWPVSVYHIFFGYRGVEAFSNAAASGLMAHLREYISIVLSAFFGGSKKLALLLGAALVLAAAFALIRRRKTSPTEQQRTPCGMLIPLLLLILPAAGYFLAVIKVAPYQVDRYVMCVYPMIAIALTCAFAFIARQLAKNRRLQAALVACAVCAFSVFGVLHVGPNYLYREITPIDECTDVFEEGPVNLIVFDGNISRNFTEFPLYDEMIWLVDSTWGIAGFFNGADTLLTERPRSMETPIIIEISQFFEASSIIEMVCDLLQITPESVEMVRSIPDRTDAWLIRPQAQEAV